MPEGDTIHYAARRVGAALVGKEILEIDTPQPRHRRDGWAQRLCGRSVCAVDAHGKHLFVRFEGDFTLHSHLRMTGAWGVYPKGQRWRRSPRRAWLVIRTAEHEVVQFDGPVLELLTEGRRRFDQRLSRLGADILAEDFDERLLLRRLREDDPTRGIGDALLDQRNVAGLGTVWKSEGCFLAGVDPWRRVRDVTDEEVVEIVRLTRPLMQASVRRGGRIVTWEPGRPGPGRAPRTWVYGRGDLPCRRCGALIRSRGQGDDNRATFWCVSCQS